jgi:protein-S-isoprenylcysteine O-methyltransferase Ste14
MPIPWSFVPLVHALAFALAVVTRLVLASRRTGAWPLTFGSADSARDFTARCFYIWVPLADFAFVGWCAWSGTAGPMLWGAWPPAAALRWIGTVLLTAGLGWVALAQAAMGACWRMGVDDVHDGELLTTGLFACSRHPVYTGIRATLLGQLLVIGSWPSLCLWALSELLVQQQARFEEEAMRARYGAAYLDYCARVRRWL